MGNRDNSTGTKLKDAYFESNYGSLGEQDPNGPIQYGEEKFVAKPSDDPFGKKTHGFGPNGGERLIEVLKIS
ncbi:MAG: hypothetical protein K9G62_08730 [Alphaproteobacteria bacterium]|nr:hypothetical protein [Alphaproteobacteria bacterium]